VVHKVPKLGAYMSAANPTLGSTNGTLTMRHFQLQQVYTSHGVFFGIMT
jgi:hypothetical protein